MALNPKVLVVGCLVVAVACAGLVGCGRKSEPLPEASGPTPSTRGESDPVTCVFESDSDLEFVARFQGQKAWVFLPAGTLVLDQVPAASGSRYSDGTLTLWTQGEEATLIRADQPDVNLRNNRNRAVWEHAKLNGVEFRAVGNEPGWVLEIWGYGRVLFVGDYGQTQYEFELPAPEIDKEARRTIYECAGREHELTIVITGTPCQDTMADQEYESTVMLTLNGKNFYGCGRALH